MKEELRHVQGTPTATVFADHRGTPLAIDETTGRQFILRADNVVVDCLALVEAGGGAWDDLRFPAQSLNPVGATAPPAISTDQAAFPGTMNFSGTLANAIAGVFQMPHSWLEGTEVHPHIHWMKAVAGAGAVGWQFKWRLMGIGVVAGAWSAWLNGVSASINGAETAAATHFISTFPAIPLTGQPDSVMVAWQLQRAGNTDAYNSIARLLEFDVHYRKNSLGSELEFPTA